jgi:hypothetical protein
MTTSSAQPVLSRDTAEYETQIHRYLKHWYPDDEMEREAEEIIHRYMDRIAEGTLQISQVRSEIMKEYPAHDQVGFTVDWQVLNLWDSILAECDIECGLK